MEKSSELKTKLQENVGPTSKWQKKIADYEKFKCEIKYMIQSYHPNIIKLYEVFEDTIYFYLVMEECSGEELFDRIYNRISENSLYKEREASNNFQTNNECSLYCHSIKICHRDLKPENLLFLNSSDEYLNIIEFGLSKIFDDKNHTMNTKVGTANYVSPEVLNGEYDEKYYI
jgi:calcium-dependent protein kinase